MAAGQKTFVQGVGWVDNVAPPTSNVVTSSNTTARKQTVASVSSPPAGMVDGDIWHQPDGYALGISASDPVFTGWRRRDMPALAKPQGMPTEADPTIAFSALFAATSLTNAAPIVLADVPNKYRYRGGTWAIGTTAGVNMAKIVSPTDPPGTSLPGSIEFASNAPAVDLRLGALLAGNMLYRLWIDNRIIYTGSTLLHGVRSFGISGNTYFQMKITFPGRAPFGTRDIRLDLHNVAFAGVYVNKEDTISLPTGNQPRCKSVWVGDSFFEGTNADSPFAGIAYTAAELLGWDEVVLAAQGGTGYLADASPRLRIRTRLSEIIAQNPDVIVIGASYNDYPVANTAQIAAEALYVHQQLRLGCPNAKIFSLGPWSLFSPPDVSRADIGTNAIKPAVESVGGSYIDMYTDPWITGSGSVGTPTSPLNGNASLYVTSASDPHPPPAGHVYLGSRIAAAIAPLLAK